jgi:hypothetical protein
MALRWAPFTRRSTSSVALPSVAITTFSIQRVIAAISRPGPGNAQMVKDPSVLGGRSFRTKRVVEPVVVRSNRMARYFWFSFSRMVVIWCSASSKLLSESRWL